MVLRFIENEIISFILVYKFNDLMISVFNLKILLYMISILFFKKLEYQLLY